MKLTNILLIIIIYLNQISYDNQKIIINEQTKPIILNIFDKIKNIKDFQIGFYIYIFDFKYEFVLISFTDFANLNIVLELKNDNFIYINQNKTNISLTNDIYFFYIKGKIIKETIQFTICIESNSQNSDIKNKTTEYIFNYKKKIKNFNFNMIKSIWGSNKNLLNFKFIGNITYLGSYINHIKDRYSQLKDVNTKLLVFHDFTKILHANNFIENNLNNGFFGSLNSYNNYKGVRIYYRLSRSSYKRYAFFNQYNSALRLSTDFIEYISSFEKIVYTVYLTFKIIPNLNFDSKNINKVNFYFYKRKNLSFFDEICFNSLNNHDFKIFSSNLMEYAGSSNGTTVFKSIFIKINNINNNKYLVTYEYNTNKNKVNDYNNFKISREEYLTFSKNDNHMIGFINDNPDSKLIKLEFYINIYELGLILGSNFYNINDKLYTKNENELFWISCNSDSYIYIDRSNNEDVCIKNNQYYNYKIRNCIKIINDKCVKCADNFLLKNNKCLTWNKLRNNFSYKLNFKNDNYLNRHKFKVAIKKQYGLYVIECTFNSHKNFILNIKINNIVKKMNYIKNDNKLLRKFNKNIFWKDEANISFESEFWFNYNCKFYEILEFKMDIIDFNSDKFLYLYKYFLINNENINLIITKDNIPTNYFINSNKIATPCPYNCNKCGNSTNCTVCKVDYQLWEGICVNINKKTKYIIKKVYENKYKSIIFEDICFKGCKSCNSPLYNECISCKVGYLYYPELKQCVKSSNCYKNYFLDKTICFSLCKKYNNYNKCIACNNMLNLNINLNKCIKCNKYYFKNLKILDSDNRPTCDKCNKNCKTCSDSKNHCTSCYDNKLIIIDKFSCIKNCPTGYYKNKNFCFKCKTDCLNCTNINKCLKCSDGKYIKNGLCVNNCGNKYFLNNNRCVNCNNNCLKCNDISKCLKCTQGYYLDDEYKCVKCNLTNQFIKYNKCISCSNNCRSCIGDKNVCLTCNKGFKLIKKQDISFCIKNCDSNDYYDIIKNKCIDCNKCDKCYDNNKTFCYNCPKCKNKCKFNIIYDDFGIHINTDKKDNIIFNENFKIKNYKTKNIISENNIEFWFKNKKKNLKLKLSNNLIKSSNNCFNIFKSKYILNKVKAKCFIKKSILYNWDNKLTLQLETNIIFMEDLRLKFYFRGDNRLIQYKIVTINYIKNISFLLIELYPNYYTDNYDISMIINKKFMNIHSSCNLVNIYKNFNIINHKNKFFKPDYIIYKEDIKNYYHSKILKIYKKINDQYNYILKNSSLVLIIINIFYTGNLLPLLSIIQWVYFLELILLLPINLGNNINTFINYLKLDLDNELNTNFFFNIKNTNEIKKYYKDKFYVNPKIADVNWINILNFQLDIIMIILLYLFHFILILVKKIIIKIKPNTDNYRMVLLNNLITNTKIIRFKLIEAFKIIIISILVVYLTNINKFKFDSDNLKILMIISFYYIILCHYFWDHINSLIYFNFSNSNNYKKNNVYYNNIITFAFNNSYLNICYQIVNSLREFLFILIIFILKNLKIHSILFWVIQIFFVIFIYLWNKKNHYFLVQKIKFEEIINLILILSWILNYHFKYEQFQILFIILYLLLLSVNLFIMWFNLIFYFFKILNLQMKKIWVLTKIKVSTK